MPHRPSNPIALSTLALVCVASCVDVRIFEDSGELRAVSFVPQTAASVCDEATPHEFVEEAPLRVQIAVGCLDHHPEIVESRCDATIEGTTIRVRSYVELRDPRSGDSICNWHTVNCASRPLTAGGYTLAFGEREREFEVPSTAPAICLSVH